MTSAIAIRTGRDRLRYVVLFEVLLIALLAPLGAAVLDRPVLEIGTLGLVLSLKAMIVNLIYTWLFDVMDAKSGRIPSKRSLAGRILHAVGLEVGLVATSLPIVIWWLELTLGQALLMDLVISLVVVVYTFLFSWSYDRLLPVWQPGMAE